MQQPCFSLAYSTEKIIIYTSKSQAGIFLIYLIFDISQHSFIMTYFENDHESGSSNFNDLTQDCSSNSKWDFKLKSSTLRTMAWWEEFLNEVTV